MTLLRMEPIDGFPDYFVTTEGKVYSVKRRVYLSPNKGNSDGYHLVLLPDKAGVRRGLRVHRLVAHAFIPNPEHKPCVNHIDGDRKNNAVDNLEWVTKQENSIHAYRRTGGWGYTKRYALEAA